MRRFLLHRPWLIFLAFGLLYAGPGLLPGRTLLPLDLLEDYDAWKGDPTVRLRVSNSLLSDPLLAFLPWDVATVRLLAAGEPPWVNVLAGDGGPLWANPQTGLLSPFTWVRLAFGFKGWALMAWLKLATAGFLAFWFAAELGVPRRQAIVSGLVYAASGFLGVWLLFPLTSVAALLPGLAAASLRLLRSPSRGAAGLVLLFAALCTAGGHPEVLFFGVLGIGLFLLLEARARPELGLTALGRPAWFAALGFLLMAVQTLPFLLLLGPSAAAAVRPEAVHPFRPWALLAQIWPGSLGSPLAGELELSAVVRADNFNNRTAGYVGALLLIAFWATWRDLAPPLRRGLAIGGAALLLSWYPPLIAPLLKKLPLFGLAAFEYLVVVFVLFASAAAGPALAGLAAAPRRRLGLFLLAVGSLAFFGGLLPALPPARPALERLARTGIESLRERGVLQQKAEVYAGRLPYYLEAAGTTTWRRLALPGFCLALAGLALSRSRLRPQTRAGLLTAAALGELIAFGWGLNPAVPRQGLPPAPDALAAIERLDPDGRFLLASHLTVFPANLATLYGRRDLVSYDVLNSSERVRQLQLAGYDPALHSLKPQLAAAEVEQLGRLGVRFVLSREDVPGAIRLPGAPPPAVGVYEIEAAVLAPRPVNRPPAGLAAGLAISLAAAVFALWGWWRLAGKSATMGPA